MIIAILLTLLFQILNLATFMLDPVESLPYNMEANLITIYTLTHSAVFLFPPLGAALVFLIFGLSIEFGYQGYQVVMRIVKLIRGAG